MSHRLKGMLVVALAVATVAVPFSLIAAAQGTKGVTFPVSGTGTTTIDDTQVPVNFEGDFTIQKFRVQGGDVVAVGTLTGDVTNAVTGAAIGSVENVATTIELITGSASDSCQILHLELGPLDLDVLGLVVHLDRVVLDITAEPGEGNLLGNLLCAIAGLLDANAPSNIIADLLNSLLDLLEWLR